MKPRGWPWIDGLRGRIAVALLAALLLQFIGGEIIFERVEAARIESGRTQRLTDWLLLADTFIDARPHAVSQINEILQPRLTLSRAAAPPPNFVSKDLPSAPEITHQILTAQPVLRSFDLRAARVGSELHAVVRLSDGDWIHFRSPDFFDYSSKLARYNAAAILLIICVFMLALVFNRMISRPLAQIAAAAERVGRDEPVHLQIKGPREIRQVAAAFDRMQTRLLHRVRDRLQALAAVSHDLRTPLARLRLNAATVTDSETRAWLEQDVAEMEAFVTSVLDYLRGNDGETAQQADVASIVMTVVDEARDAGDAVSYQGPNRLEWLTRPVKLKRLVRNIVQNAARHGGNARVTLSSDAEKITLLIDDDGPGIPGSELHTVFAPFTRVETSRSRRTGGVGLGLAIAQQFTDLLGGTITLANRAEGGLRVMILLPVPASSTACGDS